MVSRCINVFQSTWVAVFSTWGWWSCTLPVWLLKRYHAPVSVDQLWPQSQLVWWITPCFFYHPVIGVLISFSQSVTISCTSSLYFPRTSKLCLQDLKDQESQIRLWQVKVKTLDVLRSRSLASIGGSFRGIPTVPPSNFDIGHLRKYPAFPKLGFFMFLLKNIMFGKPSFI